MLTGMSVHNYKAIKNIQNLPLERFHVLIGPNGSGKSTFLDSIQFVRDCIEKGPREAVESRAPDFRDLTFMRKGDSITIEFWMDMGHILNSQKDNLLHYCITLHEDPVIGICVETETLKQYSKSWLKLKGKPFDFSENVKPRRLLGKTSKGTDFYQRESSTYQDSFNFGIENLTLSRTPPDEERFPTANAVRKFLTKGVRFMQLNSREMRLPCPATRPVELELDGTNIARVVGRFYRNNIKEKAAESLKDDSLERWTAHLSYALPELTGISWGRREADNAEYLVLHYDNGLECPSWLTSDGTLRMLALTLPAYLPPAHGIYMVEEPENGVHPKALEIILQSLSTLPDSQVFIATHSPLVIQNAGVKPLLCFHVKNDGVFISRGKDHKILKKWEGVPDLATIFASGVLE